MKTTAVNNCPCGSGKALAQCCEPYINGSATAPTAEALMRSRYTAYTQLNELYLLASWHSTTRPKKLELDQATQWLRLKIVNSRDDRVEFIATYRINGKAYKLHENSRFLHENKKWLYLDASE